MKKLILFALIIAIFFNTVNAIGQCVPNTSITTPGIFPDSATGLNSAVVGQAYNQVIQVRVPTDTVVVIAGSPQTVTINSITVLSFTNLPPGLTYTCTPSNCIFPGGTNGCVEISGTPTTSGNFVLNAILETNGTFIIFPITRQDTVDYYNINVSPATGLAGNTKFGFNIEQNSPNPFNENTNIDFTVPSKSNIGFRVYNLLGKEVYNNVFEASAGRNTISFDAKELNVGVYMYSLTLGATTLTKRMIISRR
jgi:hypothetical protein